MKIYQRSVSFYVVTLIATVSTLAMGRDAHADLTINYTIGSSLQNDAQSAQIVAAFQRAGAKWTNLFSNTATLNFTIDFAALGSNILGSTSSTANFYSYSSFRSALSANVTKSTTDVTALANLSTGSTYSVLTNRTSDNPNGSGSATPYTFTAADTTRINNANAKALGIYTGSASATDASITFSSGFRSQFDFDNTNGVDPNQFDFEGIAAHEIGHALGFVSGVDILDGNSPPFGGPFPASALSDYVTPLDFFRFSTQSASTAGGVPDFTADSRNKFFSLNKGTTVGPSFSTGTNFGDAQQASHWKDNLSLGIMDPTAGNGELLQISANDMMAFDAIGYNIKSFVIPEASTGMLLLPGLLAGALLYSRRRKR